MLIEIDSNSGFCFGVQRAIELAEETLKKGEPVYCIGDIVHNSEEIKRLEAKGMITIKSTDLPKISNNSILVRAHGEPPSTFNLIEQTKNKLFEGTCPIVIKIQKKIKKAWEESKLNHGQVVIFGKKNHAEVIGLNGQTNNEAIIISGHSDLDLIDYNRPVALFAQTTMDSQLYSDIASEIKLRIYKTTGKEESEFKQHKTICGYVSGRGEKLKLFADKHDVIIFVSGQNSSNGKVLYELCKSVNSRTYWIENELMISKDWFTNMKSVGICGATSTPGWLMEKVAETINEFK
jgi:4-hydroxy-3-methylbut-2-enyl diphosphate reductase